MREFTKLGKFLQSKRLESKLTQRELASKLSNMDSQFVSNWERGLCAPPSHAFEKIIDVLKLNREKLVEVMLEDSRKTIVAKVFKRVLKKRKL